MNDVRKKQPGWLPDPAIDDLDPETERLRYLGHGGGFITRHRALLFSPGNPGKLIPASLLSLSFLLAWWLVREPVYRMWSAMLGFWHSVLGLSDGISRVEYLLFGVIPFAVPMPQVGAGMPSTLQWWTGMLLSLILIACSVIVPRRYLPAAYLLRTVAFFQLTAQIFFHFWRDAFPYEPAGYVHGMLIASWFFLAVIPMVLGLTYYIFDFSLRQKIGLTILIMGHQVLLIPMQYAMQAYVMHAQSLLFMPLMFFVFSLPLNVVSFISFFGWGFSWECMLYDEEVQWKTRPQGL